MLLLTIKIMKMEKESNNLIIYKATNTETNMVYVGATRNSIRERRLDHERLADIENTNQFHKAIGTYGLEAFSWEQIDTASSIDELALKEKQYILKYKAKENGYNSDIGGGIKKTVYQYSLEGNLVNNYDCLESAANAVNATRKQISKTCLSINQTYGQYYWSYELQEIFQPQQDKRLKEVHQFTLDGKFIDLFKSVADASRNTGINKTSIAKVCRGESIQTGGYK